jgi:hypothetical protein
MARQRQDRVVLVGRQVQELLSQLAGGVQLCLGPMEALEDLTASRRLPHPVTPGSIRLQRSELAPICQRIP